MRKTLKHLRVENDLTQEEMSKRIGVSRVAYCNIEKGKRKGGLSFWLAVKKAFPEIDINELAKEQENEE